MNTLSFTDFLSGIIIILIGVVIYILKISTPEYFKQKAKNLAQKEDITEITEKIKSIETTFQKDLEVVKSQLSLSTQLQTNFRNEERSSIIEFNESIFSYYNLLSSAYIATGDEYNNEDVTKARSFINQLYIDLILKHHKMSLFLEGEDSEDIRAKSFKLIHEIRDRFNKHYIELHYNIIQTNIVIGSDDVSHENRIEAINRRPDIFQKYYSSVNPLIEPTITSLLELRNILKKHLLLRSSIAI